MNQLHQKIKRYYNNYSIVIANMSYIAIFQIFTMFVPLITYQYLIRVLGADLYGWVITAQILVSYASLFIDYGFRKVTARHISIHRDNVDKLSEIVSAVTIMKMFLWTFAFVVYLSLIFIIPGYKKHLLLFLITFGLTFNELLFPQFYFQGIEKMKYVTILNILIKSVFVVLTFMFIDSKDDYILVPLFLTFGSILGGAIAFYIIFYQHKLSFIIPTKSVLKYYTKDATPVFCTDMICTIKDKLNYFLIGGMLNMRDVSLYDLGSKIMNVVARFVSVIGVAMFPRMAKDKNIKLFVKTGGLIMWLIVVIVIVLQLFLPFIVPFLYAERVDMLPIRLYLLALLFLEVSSYISSNLFIAQGYNKYVLYSMIFTTVIYILILIVMLVGGYLSTVTAFVIVALSSYVAEFLYRIYLAHKIISR